MVHTVQLARRCWLILPQRQSHGHQLQLAGRLRVTKNQRYLITVCKKSDMRLGKLDSLFRVIGWSFNVLQTGIEPVVDWEGKDLMCEDPMYLAAKYQAVLTHSRGDWDFHASISSLSRWNNVARMCWLCHATGTEGHVLSYKRCDRDDARQLFDNGQALPSLFQNTKGLRIESIVINSIHTAELGITAHVLGNLFQLCIKAVCSEQPLTPRSRTWQSISMHGRSSRRRRIVSTTSSRKTAFVPRTAGPKLHTTSASGRCLVPYALGLARQHLEPQEQLVCQLLMRYYTLLPSFFSHAAKVEMAALGLRFCKEYSKFAAV